MQKVTAIVGGSVGSDPYAANTWSGSAARLFTAMSDHGLLDQAMGVDLPRLQKALLMAKNFRPDRGVWRKHFFFDTAYRAALTRAASRLPVASPITFQLGSMYSLAEAFPAKKSISYHDGNLPELVRSGFGLNGVSKGRIDDALRYEERVSNGMTAVFTMSEYLRQSFIRDFHVPAERVFNVGGAINLTKIPAADPEKSYAAPRLLFLGAEFERKGGKVLLEAFREVRAAMPAAELHIAGPRGLTDLPAGVTSHGFLSKADPAQRATLEGLFRGSSLFVLPSLYEPFGIAPLEAMLYGLPCVVTRAWALAETVTPGVNGDLVTKGDAGDLATKILGLLGDPDRLAAMGRGAREMVLSRYTWPAVVERMAGVIERL